MNNEYWMNNEYRYESESCHIQIGNVIELVNPILESLKIFLQPGSILLDSLNKLIGLVSNTELGLAFGRYPRDIHFLIRKVVLLWDFVLETSVVIAALSLESDDVEDIVPEEMFLVDVLAEGLAFFLHHLSGHVADIAVVSLVVGQFLVLFP